MRGPSQPTPLDPASDQHRARAEAAEAAEEQHREIVRHVCEAASSNVFLFNRGVLLTPSLASGCLPGITREVVIEQTARLGITCHETELTAADLDAADEIFLTSSIRGLMGVSRLVDRNLAPGEITAALREAWWQAAMAG